MKSFIATALCLFSQSHATEETSLMQGLVARRGQLTPDAKEARKDATAKLMETATKMMKNGATPDVLTFIDTTITEVEMNVLQAIVDEHNHDQALIYELVARIQTAVDAMQECANSIRQQQGEIEVMQSNHKMCRSGESLACARSRKCEDELEEKWIRVVIEEEEMRRIHGEIYDGWCIPGAAPPHPSLADPWNWHLSEHYEGDETSESVHMYPEVELGPAVIEFRRFNVEYFRYYIEQLPRVEIAWEEYNAKLIECAAKEETWQLHVDECDALQDELNQKACEHAGDSRQCSSDYGHEYEMAVDLYRETETRVRELEYDRKREWETLHIVTCLLRTVYTHVIHSIDSGEPCPTTDSDPEQTEAEINYCHVVEESLTANLTIIYPPVPVCIDCDPEWMHPPCTPEYLWETQGSFSAELQASHSATITTEGLEEYFTLISAFGWAGCAAPKACVPCETADLVVDPNYVENSQCKEHHSHLRPGQMDWDTFKCLSGDQCVRAAGRCNEVSNCDDGSDELGCDTTWGEPALLHSEECKSPFVDDLQFRCADNTCTHIAGKCNGIANCADGSDEVGCATTTHGVTLEAMTGFTSTVVTPALHDSVFTDREYTLDELGSFTGRSFIKMSNEDKHIRHSHIQMKIRLPRPMTVYVVKMDTTNLPWLAAEGWTHTLLEGISYHGVRQTRHTDWSGELNEDFYTAGQVFQKTFPAGTVSLRGNNGGDGSFVMFIAHPSDAPQPPNCPNCLPGHDTYIGCYTDNSARDLGTMVGAWTNSATNTYELCRAECVSRGNLYMSLQWGGECFCADEYATADAYYQVDDNECNVVREPCSPNSHNCGGTWRQAIYQIMDDSEPAGAPEGWQTLNENWNCAGTGGNGALASPSVTSRATCAHACYEEGHAIAAFWHEQNICRCYDSCPGGGPTSMPAWPNLVMEKVYHLASTDKKCPHQHSDRLFRDPEAGSSSITLDACYRECQATPTCAHFSWGAHDGGYVCMGCTTLENEQTHVGFNTYNMERSTPPSVNVGNWDFEGMTTNGQMDTLAEGKWIHFSNNGNSGLTNPAILNWQCQGGCGSNGIYNPPNNEVAEGTHVLFLNAGHDTAYVYQDLMNPFNWDIHIEAAVGGGNGNNDGGYRMQLWAGDNLVKEVAAGENGAPDTGTVSVREYVLTHLTLTTEEAPSYVGQTLQLRLKKNKSGQGHYHYIRFT